MIKKKFSREYLLEELELPYASVEDEIIEATRWSLIHKLVFEDKDGTFWETWYSEGATEMQEEEPWEYENEVECTQVCKSMALVSKFIPIDEVTPQFKDLSKEEVAAIDKYLKNCNYYTGMHFLDVLNMRYGDDGR